MLVLPGFLASDFSTMPLRSFLSGRGYGAKAESNQGRPVSKTGSSSEWRRCAAAMAAR